MSNNIDIYYLLNNHAVRRMAKCLAIFEDTNQDSILVYPN